MGRFDVFISHSRHDKSVADDICKILEINGFTCWIAPRNIRPGQHYALEIMCGLKSCQMMVLVFSAYSNQSEHVANELDHAFNEKKSIIPFLIDGTPINDEFDYYLSRKQHLIAYPRYEDKLTALVKAVAKTLGRPITPNKKENDLLLIKQNDLYGFADKLGKVVIPCKWLGAEDFSEGLAAIMAQNGRWGYINKTGKVVIPCCWSNANSFNNGCAQVFDNAGRAFSINKKGLIISQR